MGGGASALREMEEIITCAYLLGRSIVAMTFPDMYSIRDFHSPDAPPLKSVRLPFDDPLAMDRQDDDDQSDEEAFDYSNRFVVIVGDDKVVIDDVGHSNEDGWTPLHSCCHSHTTVSAGLAIIEEMKRKGCSFEIKTRRGPGAHNSGWTALHMAAAYGVEPLVIQLLAAGANPNCRNSLTWSPLHEACHRGFITIVRELLDKGASMSYIPELEATTNYPYSRPPPQSPLGEAARCGFTDICRLLLDRGAQKDQKNELGWTPLHEASFYNYVDVVRLLLVYGADGAARNNQGALPFQLATLLPVRDAILELGGEDAAPRQGEEAMFLFNATPLCTIEDQGGSASVSKDKTEEQPRRSPKKSTPHPKTPSKSPGESSELLHTGKLLGDLPSLSAHKLSPQQEALHTSFEDDDDQFRREVRTQRKSITSPFRGMDPKDVPKHFLCSITKKPLADPVKTPYGHTYEREAIMTWIGRNGSIDPLTGQPLSVAELRDDEDILADMKKWQLEHAFKTPSIPECQVQAQENSGNEDDLYDF